MKFALITLVATAAAKQSLFCDKISMTDSDSAFDYYDTKHTGSIGAEQVKQAMVHANKYISQELINDMVIDANMPIDTVTDGLLCNGMDPNRNRYHYVQLNMWSKANAKDLADCKSKCVAHGQGCSVVAFRQWDKYCAGYTQYSGSCGPGNGFNTYKAGTATKTFNKKEYNQFSNEQRSFFAGKMGIMC